jgi:hypothetical protein
MKRVPAGLRIAVLAEHDIAWPRRPRAGIKAVAATGARGYR